MHRQFFAKTEKGKIVEFPVSIFELKRRFPTTFFPEIIKTKDVEHLGYVRVFESARPEPKKGVNFVPADEPEMVKGEWVIFWKEAPWSPEAIESFWRDIRIRRNRLLRMTDWTQLPDVPKEQAKLYKAFRQELRDLPQKYENPWDVRIPKSPKEK